MSDVLVRKLYLQVITVIVILFGGLTACSDNNKPSDSELIAALASQIDRNFEVSTLDVTASENRGDNVTPLFATRFEATVSSQAVLYEMDSVEGGVTFVTQTHALGDSIKVFGVIESRINQGDWNHDVRIEGKPFLEVGRALEQFPSKNPVMVAGTEEAMAEQARQLKEAKDEQARVLAAEVEKKAQIEAWLERRRNELQEYTSAVRESRSGKKLGTYQYDTWNNRKHAGEKKIVLHESGFEIDGLFHFFFDAFIPSNKDFKAPNNNNVKLRRDRRGEIILQGEKYNNATWAWKSHVVVFQPFTRDAKFATPIRFADTPEKREEYLRFRNDLIWAFSTWYEKHGDLVDRPTVFEIPQMEEVRQYFKQKLE